MIWSVRLGWAGIMVGALCGCATPGGSAVSPATPSPHLPECTSIYQGVLAGRLPAGSQLTQATVCVAGAPPMTVTRANAGADLDRLAGLLAQPDATRPPDRLCTAEVRPGTDFVVKLDDGTIMAPAVPLDECGKYDLTALGLLAGLTLPQPQAS